MRSRLNKLFIPSAENGYAPSALQRVAMLSMAVLITLAFAVTNIQSLVWQFSDFLVAAILPSIIVDLTNDERAVNNAQSLMRSEVLDAAARLKAEHMAQNQYFSHFAPDGTSPWYWFSQVDYRYVHAGENLAIHFVDSNAVVDAWMNSPTHRANIVDPTFTEIGIGTARGTYQGFDTIYVVQLFGTPRARAVASGEGGVVATAPTPASVLPPAASVLAETTTIEELESDPVASFQTAEPEPEPMPTPIETPPVEVPPVETPVVAEATPVPPTESVQYLETISTTAPGIPASIEVNDQARQQRGMSFVHVLTQPGTVMQVVYLMLAGFISMILLISVFIEVRHQHPLQIAYALLLLIAMGGLYTIHMRLIDGVLIA